MNKQIDNLLLGVLWMLACVLGASFWFNTRFGFDILQVSHWQYLGSLQASDVKISSGFYLSIVIVVFILIFGLYLIGRKQLRKISFFSQQTVVPEQPVINIVNTEPLTESPVITATEPITISAARPPRLNIGVGAHQAPATNNLMANPEIRVSAPIQPIVPTVTAPSANVVDVENIFKSSGYLVKKPPRIGGVRPILFAVGPDEVLWIGTENTDFDTVNNSVEKLQALFKDTLEDIEITVNSFIINPLAVAAQNIGDIKIFNSVAELEKYISENPANKVGDEAEDFEAYSEYIDTVASYFDKL